MADKCVHCLQDLFDPRVLGCLHTFCYQCVSTFQKNGQVHCPQCFYVTECEAISIPKDLAMDRFFRMSKGLKSCNNCAERDAVAFCSECCASMCEFCSKGLHANPVLRHHRVRNLHGARQPTAVDFCVHHREEVSVFCLTCRRWICRDCLTAHRGHDFVEQDRAAEGKMALHDRIVGLTYTLRNVQTKSRNATQGMEDALKELKKCTATSSATINSYIDLLAKTLEARRVTLLTTLEQRATEKHRLLEHQLNSLKNLDHNMERSLEFIRMMTDEKTVDIRYLVQMEAWASHYTSYVSQQRIATTPCVSPNIGVTFPLDMDNMLHNLGDLSTPSCPEKVFAFKSIGDQNGVLQYLGTSRGCGMYTNPASNGSVKVTCSSLGYGAVENVVNSERGDFCTQNLPSSWVTVELPLACTLQPSAYSFGHDKFDAGAHFIRSWELQGLDPTHTWVKIKEHKVETTINPSNLHGHWNLDAGGKRFSAFRIVQTGPNSEGNHYLMMSSLELYGKFFEE